MAIPKTVAFENAVRTIVGLDMRVEKEFFGGVKPQNFHTQRFVEYHVKTESGTAASYRSFAEKAQVVKKSGMDAVRVEPFMINLEVERDAFDAEAQKFGSTPYQDGGYETDPVVMAREAHRPALIRRKKMMGALLSNGKLTAANDGIDAEFNIPAENFKVLTGDAKWDTTTSTPIADIKGIVRGMKSKPTRIVMNPNTWGNMVANGEDVVINTDQAGKNEPQNVYIDKASNNEWELRRVAQIIDGELNVDVYVWADDENGTYYMEDGAVAFSKKGAGEVHFAGVPKVIGGTIKNRATDIDIDNYESKNPVSIGKLYRSAPMYILKNNEGWAFLKAY